MKIITSSAMNISAITSFEKNIEQLSVSIRNEVAKFEPEPTFEKTINDIRDHNLKSITSIDMNISDIILNKRYSSSEHLKYDLMPWIILQSPENHHNSPIICLQCTLKKTPN